VEDPKICATSRSSVRYVLLVSLLSATAPTKAQIRAEATDELKLRLMLRLKLRAEAEAAAKAEAAAEAKLRGPGIFV